MTDDAGDDPPTPPRPGPDVLYGETPTPPQLENGEGWDADPLLVCGADAYVDGEYLYQDWIHDDHGADLRTMVDGPPEDGDRLGGLYSQPTGDVYYPTDEDRYGYNAADLLEFRARPTDDGVAYRVTLNTMLEPDAACVAVGIRTADADEGDLRTDWGHGLGDLNAPVDHVLVTWGEGATLDGEPLADERVAVDVERNQIAVDVPLDPGEATWRHHLVTGLWDPQIEAFRQVAVEPDERTPGGKEDPGDDPPPVFNAGFRFEEPFGAPDTGALDLGRELVDVVREGGPRWLGHGSWRDHRQARALAKRDVSRLYTDVDFGRLREGVTDRSGVPTEGYLNLLYPSRRDYGEGVDPDANFLRGRIQPYAAYVPEGAAEQGALLGEAVDAGADDATVPGRGDDREDGLPLVVLLHSLGGTHNQYAVYTPNYVRHLGEEFGSAVLIPETRGPAGWFQREAEVDVFEAMRDFERRYPVDRSRVSLSGYSMGGYGTLLLAAQHPDVFGRGFAVVGPPAEDPVEGTTNNLLRAPKLVTRKLFGGDDGEVLSIFSETRANALRIADNLRHVPLLLWNGVVDPLVPILAPANFSDRLTDLGYRHQLDLFLVTHLLLVLRDHWRRGGEYLSATRIPENPARVTYRRVPEHDHPELGLVHDGAHWVDDIAVADGAETGLVDATSYANGYVTPQSERFSTMGTEPLPHQRRGLRWTDPGAEDRHEAANALGVRLRGASGATLWVEEAGLDPEERLTMRVESTAPATLTLAGSFGTHEIEVEEGETTVRVTLADEVAAAE